MNILAFDSFQPHNDCGVCDGARQPNSPTSPVHQYDIARRVEFFFGSSGVTDVSRLPFHCPRSSCAFPTQKTQANITFILFAAIILFFVFFWLFCCLLFMIWFAVFTYIPFTECRRCRQFST